MTQKLVQAQSKWHQRVKLNGRHHRVHLESSRLHSLPEKASVKVLGKDGLMSTRTLISTLTQCCYFCCWVVVVVVVDFHAGHVNDLK